MTTYHFAAASRLLMLRARRRVFYARVSATVAALAAVAVIAFLAGLGGIGA